MPRRVMQVRRLRGYGFLNFIKKANKFLKKTHAISRVGKFLGSQGLPYAGKIGSAASSVGYGRRRGAGLQLPGRVGGGSRRPIRHF